MSYEIKAILARTDTFRKAKISFPIVKLNYGIGLLPLSEEILKKLNIKRLLLANFSEIIIDKELDNFGLSISKHGKTAFIQANLFGGIGDQAAIVWEGDDRTILEVSKNAINHAIEEVDDDLPTRFSTDEFDCLELGKFRYTEEWVKVAEPIVYK
jgi:hypothetical protein